MNQPVRTRGVKALKAVSSPLRLHILNLLFDKDSLSYTELMNELKLNPSRDAGKFAYHLKFMLKAGLVEVDSDAKKYFLTDLGKMVLDVADRIERKAVKPNVMLVRTSHLAIEEFDANKITNALIREAKMPAELAQRTAKEAEKRLVKSKIKYLIAPLIREVVNGILIEKGLDDYRHKLTRVGMPIHEVAALIESKETVRDSSSTISFAGETVMAEYTLLNIFPRDIADAHLSGTIHVDDLGTWILKPLDVVHDTHYFFQRGLNLHHPQLILVEPPNNFESAISLILNILMHTSKETDSVQVINHLNVILSPFANGIEDAKLKESLRIFILSVSQHAETTLGLEVRLSKKIAEKESTGPQGRAGKKYGDYTQECLRLASLILDVFIEESEKKPLLNPKLVIKLDENVLANQDSKAILLKAHQIAIKGCAIYFANITKKDNENAVYSGSGIKFGLDLTGDWETDSIRVGCIGSVTINLPRIALECEQDKAKFFEILKERLELAARALTIKNNALKNFGKNILPFLLQKGNGDTYFRLENCSRLINFSGLIEAVELFTGKKITSVEGKKFTEEVISTALNFKQKASRKYGKRLHIGIFNNRKAAERLAQLDIERYGVAKVKFSGTREKPFYSTLKRICIKFGQPLLVPSGTRETAQLFERLCNGGSLDIYELDDNQYDADSLMNLSKRIIENSASEFFTYNRMMYHCNNCKKNYCGTFHKCPTCGSISTLIALDRFAPV